MKDPVTTKSIVHLSSEELIVIIKHIIQMKVGYKDLKNQSNTNDNQFQHNNSWENLILAPKQCFKSVNKPLIGLNRPIYPHILCHIYHLFRAL